MAETDDVEQLAAETLHGDLRDIMLTHIRSMETPWSKMSEAAQADKIYAISNACETQIRRAVAIIAARGADPVFGKVTKFTVKDEIKAELVCSSSVSNIERVAENINQPAIVIFASPEVFLGERKAATAGKDQPDLPIEDEDEEDKPVFDSTAAGAAASVDMPKADPAKAPAAA